MMIKIICSAQAYTYNAYHIVKAFYPAVEITNHVEEKASNYVEINFSDGQVIAVEKEEIKAGTDAEKKAQIDKKLYEKLSKKSGKTLAWGILTGVRPTKLAMKKLEEGMESEEFVSWFRQTYLVSEEKARLAWEIAGREKKLLDRLDYEDGYSLYVGIPFCPTVCTYCSFSSGALEDWKDFVDAYVEALCKELAFIGEVSKEKKLNSIYIGGGTPTSLNARQLERILSCIDTHFSREYLLEYTVEAGRPDSITEEKLQVIKAHKVTRISINPQTMQQRTLDLIGRRHSVEQTVESFKIARELGFDDINMDLIMGLPEESLEDVRDTLEQIMQLKPDNLTVHSLALKRAARLNMFKEDYKDYKMVNTQEHMDLTASYAKKMDLFPYYLYRQKGMAGNLENVGYAKEGKAGVYNILIMEEKQTIVACGAGASTKRVWTEPNPDGTHRIERCENVKDVGQYIERIDEMIERKQKLFAEE